MSNRLAYSSKDEWQILFDYLGGDINAGKVMKESGTTHWNSPNTANNSSGLRLYRWIQAFHRGFSFSGAI